MRRNEYVAQPTAAAIDTAMARALSLEPQEDQAAPDQKTFRERAVGVLGQSGTFERGFVQTALLLVGGLVLGRMLTDNTALLGAMVPLALLASLVTQKVIRGIAVSRDWLASKPRQVALGIACSPALTWLARGSFDRTERAAVWTSWAAALVGLLALLT